MKREKAENILMNFCTIWPLPSLPPSPPVTLLLFFFTVFYPHWLPFSSSMTETLLPPQGLCTCSYLCQEISPIWFSCAWSFFTLQISVLTLSPNGGSDRLSSAPHLALFPSWHWSWPGVVRHLWSTDTAWQQALHGSNSLQCFKGLEQQPHKAGCQSGSCLLLGFQPAIVPHAGLPWSSGAVKSDRKRQIAYDTAYMQI